MIEEGFGVHPGGGEGALEWAIVAALLVITATLSLVAAGDWLRSRTQSRTAS
jgi:hypothetical protein